MLGRSRAKDKQQLTMIQDGDKDALVALYKDCFTTVKNIVIQQGGSEIIAEDIMQDAVIAVWQNCRKPDFKLTSLLTTYTIAIAKNLWYKEMSKTKRMVKGNEEPHVNKMVFTPENDAPMDMTILTNMVNSMGETCRELLVLFYFDGLDTKTIAEKMNFANTNTVKSKKYQCFKRLQEKMTSKFNMEDFF